MQHAERVVGELQRHGSDLSVAAVAEHNGDVPTIKKKSRRELMYCDLGALGHWVPIPNKHINDVVLMCHAAMM